MDEIMRNSFFLGHNLIFSLLEKILLRKHILPIANLVDRSCVFSKAIRLQTFFQRSLWEPIWPLRGKNYIIIK